MRSEDPSVEPCTTAHFAISPPHLLSHSISPYHPLSSRYPHSSVPLHRPLPSPPFLQPPPYLLPFFLPLLSLSLSPPSLLFSLSLQGKTLSASSALGPWTRTRDVNRSKVGMANLRTVTNTIWAHLFFSSTVLSLRPTLGSIFRRGRAVSRSRTIYSNRRDSSNFSRSTANGRRERPRGERIRSKGRAEFQAKHDEKIAYSSVRCWKLLYGGWLCFYNDSRRGVILFFPPFSSYPGVVARRAYVITPKWRDFA